MSDAIVLAYLAGIVDADGFITVHRKAGKARTYFSPVIGITGTRREPHDLAAEEFGGRVRDYVNRSDRNRRMFQWGRSSEPAVTVIAALRPYLRVKARQADLALHLAETLVIAPEVWPADLAASLEDTYEEMRSLNLRGKTA